MATFEIKLWDETVRINSEYDKEFISDVADYLNTKMAEVNQGNQLTTKIIALRAAFLVTMEFMKMQRSVTELEKAVGDFEEKIDSLFISE